MAGGGGETTSTVTQSNLPEYAEPYFKDMMNRAQAESSRPYQNYQGPRLPGMSTQTAQGLDMAQQYAQSDTGLGAAYNAAQGAAQTGQNASNANITNSYTGPAQGNYQGSNISAQQMGFGQGGINQINSQDFGQAQANQYMSPYMDSVINQAKDAAVNNFRDEQQYRDAQAVSAGAFGGSRAAVQNQMAANALQKNLTNIDVQGRQSAFENAQQQFERDRLSGMNAQQANQQAGLTMGQANQSANLNAQQMNEQSRQFGYGATEDAYRAAGQLGLQAQQATWDTRLGGGNLMNQSGQMMGGLGQLNDEMLQNRIKQQLGIGQAAEGYQQQQLDMGYNDFVNQRDANRQNLQFLSSILRGVPISANSDTQVTQPTNPLAGLMGTAGGLNALYQLGKQG